MSAPASRAPSAFQCRCAAAPPKVTSLRVGCRRAQTAQASRSQRPFRPVSAELVAQPVPRATCAAYLLLCTPEMLVTRALANLHALAIATPRQTFRFLVATSDREARAALRRQRASLYIVAPGLSPEQATWRCRQFVQLLLDFRFGRH